MPYKPKHCCQCGEKIDRINWKPWTSRRFCELCETDYVVYDWLTRALFIFGLLLGLFGIGSIFQKPEKQLSYSPNQFANSAPNKNVEISNQKTNLQVLNKAGVQTSVQTNNSNSQLNPQIAPLVADLKKEPSNNLTKSRLESTYYCGAQTKKGTLCSRRVKGGGRCWQHVGQAAMLPQAKLIVSE